MRLSFRQTGFTLIELIIVLAVIGILVTVVISVFDIPSILHQARLANARAFNSQVKTSLALSQIGEWNFEEGSGPIAIDTSGYGNNGTIGNPATMWQNSNQCDLGFGGCIAFNGTNNDIRFTRKFDYSQSPDQLTISFWMKVAADIWTLGYPSYTIVGDFDGSGFLVRLDPAGCNKVLVFITYQSASQFNTHCGPSFSENSGLLGRWNYVVLTYNKQVGPNQTKIYLNGKLHSTQTNTHSISNTSANWPALGAIGWFEPDYFKGSLDQVAIYTKMLISSQIQQLYAHGLLRHLVTYK